MDGATYSASGLHTSHLVLLLRNFRLDHGTCKSEYLHRTQLASCLQGGSHRPGLMMPRTRVIFALPIFNDFFLLQYMITSGSLYAPSSHSKTPIFARSLLRFANLHHNSRFASQILDRLKNIQILHCQSLEICRVDSTPLTHLASGRVHFLRHLYKFSSTIPSTTKRHQAKRV